MLVQCEHVEAQIFSVTVFIKIVMVVVGCLFTVEKFIGNCEERAVLQNLFFGQLAIRPFGEVTYLHVEHLSRLHTGDVPTAPLNFASL
jgi:hypothetical protein